MGSPTILDAPDVTPDTAARDMTTLVEPRLIAETGVAARVAAMARPVRGGEGVGPRRLHRPDHGGARGRLEGDRRMRSGIARALPGARHRRSDRPGLSAPGFLPRAPPGAAGGLGVLAAC